MKRSPVDSRYLCTVPATFIPDHCIHLSLSLRGTRQNLWQVCIRRYGLCFCLRLCLPHVLALSPTLALSLLLLLSLILQDHKNAGNMTIQDIVKARKMIPQVSASYMTNSGMNVGYTAWSRMITEIRKNGDLVGGAVCRGHPMDWVEWMMELTMIQIPVWCLSAY